MDETMTRTQTETLVTMCAGHHSFTHLAPSSIASAAVLVTLRPLFQGGIAPSPVSGGANSDIGTNEIQDLDGVLDAIHSVTQLDKVIWKYNWKG